MYFKFSGIFALILMVFLTGSAFSQQRDKSTRPDLAVAGVKLADRASAKAFLGNFQPRTGEDGRPAYYFFNRMGDQVIKLTASSFEDRFFIEEIEVFRVGKSYTAGHFQNEKINIFKTDNEIFVGRQQTAATMLIGIPNVDGKERAGTKTVAKKLGEPTERKVEGDAEVLSYKIDSIELPDENNAGKTMVFGYSSRYEFNDGKLKRFVIAIHAKK